MAAESCSSAIKEDPFNENAGARKRKIPLKGVSISTGTDIEGLVKWDDLSTETDIKIPLDTEVRNGVDGDDSPDDDLPPLDIEEDENLPEMTEEEVFWHQACLMAEKELEEAKDENKKIRGQRVRTQARLEETKVLRETKLGDLQERINEAKRRKKNDEEPKKPEV